MTNSNSPPQPNRLRLANELLQGFDTGDEETRNFLASIIVSGNFDAGDERELVRLSLMRGVEEWNMLFARAGALRDGIGRVGCGRSLVPFLGRVLGLSGERGQEPGEGTARTQGQGKRKVRAKRPGKLGGKPARSVSHYWRKPNDWEPGIRHTSRQPVVPSNQSVDTQTVADGQDEPGGASHSPDKALSTDAHNSQEDSPGSMTEPHTLGSQDLGFSASHAHQPAKHLHHPKHSFKSPFFMTPSPSPRKRPPRGTISSLPIPLLTASSFGLIQESLASSPFCLLIAVTFLIRTKGTAAIPVFQQLMARFPEPKDLAAADSKEIIDLIRPLGLSAVRCAAIQRYARGWVARPPTRDVRFGVRNYPREGDARHVTQGEEFGPEDIFPGSGSGSGSRGEGDAAADAENRGVGCAWEIGHLTSGAYALDSWRIFCRDQLLGRAQDWKGKGAAASGFQPEWMRVVPADKELRACLRWMWMREGWMWDPETGEKEILPEEMTRAMDEGRVGYDEMGGLVITAS